MMAALMRGQKRSRSVAAVSAGLNLLPSLADDRQPTALGLLVPTTVLAPVLFSAPNPRPPAQPKAAAPLASPKSERRRRAEEALSYVIKRGREAREQDEAAPKRRKVLDTVVVPSCQSPTCQSSKGPSSVAGWCSFPLRLPQFDLDALNQSLQAAAAVRALSMSEPRTLLADGVEVILVDNASHLPAALGRLRASMKDRVVAIDLEWKPDRGTGYSRVAMMQLSSATCALLIRISRMGFKAPLVLQDFLQDPNITLCGFSWDSSDEKKMRATFSFGRDLFGSFVDLQQVSSAMGYKSLGLKALSGAVLGWHMQKPRTVTMSNWEAANLTPAQISYAALDVLAAGHLFRCLRHWHAKPLTCHGCSSSLGTIFSSSANMCCSCNMKYKSRESLRDHLISTGHDSGSQVCSACGRYMRSH